MPQKYRTDSLDYKLFFQFHFFFIEMAKDTQREVLPSTARVSSNGNKSEYKDEKWLIELEKIWKMLWYIR